MIRENNLERIIGSLKEAKAEVNQTRVQDRIIREANSINARKNRKKNIKKEPEEGASIQEATAVDRKEIRNQRGMKKVATWKKKVAF